MVVNHPIPAHDTSAEQLACFIIMPFDHLLDSVHQIIRDAAIIDCGCTCERADDIYSAGVVMDDVIARIRNARVVIADVTGKNPNVLYEMGIAHGLDKQVVILAQDISDVPFDLRHHRMIVYRIDALEDLRVRIAKTVFALQPKRPTIRQWIETDRPTVRIGLASPVSDTIVGKSPIESAGRVVGLPNNGIAYRVQAFVVTDREYEQSSSTVDRAGYWTIGHIYLGAHRHALFYRLYDESGVLFATSNPIQVILQYQP